MSIEWITQVRGIAFEGSHDVLVGEELRKEDVPIGTEVWLAEIVSEMTLAKVSGIIAVEGILVNRK